MLSAAKLSQHAVSQSEAREVRHAIPACNNIDKLSQHAVAKSEARKARHAIPACKPMRPITGWKKLDMLSQHTQLGQTCYPSMHYQNLNCIKEAAKAQNSGQADTAK